MIFDPSWRPASLEEIEEAFDLYTAAVGRVAAAWNRLHDRMENLFCKIMNADSELLSAVWHSTYSDRSQRQMLEAAIKASKPLPLWGHLPDTANEDLLWLMKRSHSLSDKRDEAVHAPCWYFEETAGGIDVIVSAYSKHRRARALEGKDLLIEFDWLERYIRELILFTDSAAITIPYARAAQHGPSWPQKPRVPDRRPKTALRGRLRRPPPK